MESTATMAGAGERAVDAPTLAQALRRTAANHPEVVAVRSPDDSVSLTWAQLRERSDALAGGLAGLGVQRGETVALMLSNRPEFHVCDLAAVTLGATPFSIYLTYPAAITSQEFSFSTVDALGTLALISLSLAIVNLFPFLPLDGGHVFWALAEKVRGRRISFQTMERAGMVGFALILVLFAIGLSNDISSLTGNGFNVR
jgi:Zn-dependent protease